MTNRILTVILTHGDYYKFLLEVYNGVNSFTLPDDTINDIIVVTDSEQVLTSEFNSFIKDNGVDLRIVTPDMSGYVSSGKYKLDFVFPVTGWTEEQVYRVNKTRQAYLDIARTGNYDYLLNIDGDAVPPTDALEKLLEANKKCIGGWSYNKKIGGVSVFPMKIQYGDVYEVKVLGQWALLEHKDIFNNLDYSLYGEGKDKTDDVKRQHEIRSVLGEKIFCHPGVYSEHLLEPGSPYIPTNDAVEIDKSKAKKNLKNKSKIKTTSIKNKNIEISSDDYNTKCEVLSSGIKLKKGTSEFEITIDDNNTPRTFSKKNEKLTLKGADNEIRAYVVEPYVENEDDSWKPPELRHPDGALELDIVYEQIPSSNVVTFNVSTDYNYVKQPKLTSEKREEMNTYMDFHIPEDVEDSYVLYKDDKKHFHIYRPKVIDALGESSWCEMDVTAGKLTITMDNDFLANATYPVVLDPTLGYTTTGGSETYINYGVATKFVLSTESTFTEMSAYLGTVSGTRVGRMAIYDCSDLSLVAETPQATFTGNSKNTIDFSSPVTLSAGTYYLAIYGDYSGYDNTAVKFDSGDTGQSVTDITGTFTAGSSNCPDPLTENTAYDIKLTISAWGPEKKSINSASVLATCISAPTLVSPGDTTSGPGTVYLVWEIPTECDDNNIHARVEIDTVDTFDSGDLKVYKSYQDSGFEYDNGGFIAYPVAGVTNTFYGEQARLAVILSTDTWYWRVRGEVTTT